MPSAWEDPIHDVRTVHDHRTDLLPVDRLRRGCAAMADQPGDPLERNLGIGKQRHEAVPQFARSPLAGSSPATETTLRKARRTCEASASVPKSTKHTPSTPSTHFPSRAAVL